MNRILAFTTVSCLVLLAMAAGSATAANVTYGPPSASPPFFASPARQIGLSTASTANSALDLYGVFGTFGSSTLQIRNTDTPGNWVLAPPVSGSVQNASTSNSPQDLALGDANNDGFVDVAVASAGGVQLARGSAGGVYTALASPAGTSFAASTGVAFARINNDSLLDMVVAVSGVVELYLNTGNTTAPFNAFSSLSGDPSHVDVIAADFDGDGDQDVATASSSTNEALIFLNTSGVLASHLDVKLFTRPGSIAAGDVNGDGRAELLVSEPDRDTVAVVNTGLLPSTIGPVTRIRTGMIPWHVASADLDADGKAEIVTANAGADSVTVASVGGTSNDYPAGPTPVSVALGDINGDGRADIVVANDESLNVSTLANLGAPVVPLPLPPAPTASLACKRKTARKITVRVTCTVKLANVTGAKRYTAKLTKGRKTFKTLRVAAGKRLTFSFRKGLAAGRYKVSLTVSASGGTITSTRNVTVPRVR